MIKNNTQAELDRLEERFKSNNFLSAFKLGRDLGVRCGECFGLLWSDIDWDKHTIKVNKQLVYEDRMWCLRNTKAREIELQDSIYTYLKELKVTQEHQKDEMGTAYRETKVTAYVGRNMKKEIVTNLDFINIKPNGELLTPDSAKVLARIASVELGYNFKYHNLRHSHASELAIKGASVLVSCFVLSGIQCL